MAWFFGDYFFDDYLFGDYLFGDYLFDYLMSLHALLFLIFLAR